MDGLCILKIQQHILIKSSCFPIGGEANRYTEIYPAIIVLK